MDIETNFVTTAANVPGQHHNALTIIKNAKPSKVPGSAVRSRALSISFYPTLMNPNTYQMCT